MFTEISFSPVAVGLRNWLIAGLILASSSMAMARGALSGRAPNQAVQAATPAQASGKPMESPLPIGTISTYAGNGTQGFSGNGGPAKDAELGIVTGLAVDKAGNLYISDYYFAVVWKVDQRTGIISIFAGIGGIVGQWGEGGPATKAVLGEPVGLAFDAAGNLYIADSAYNVIRKVDLGSGIMTTVVGFPTGCTNGICSPGKAGYLGDGGPATKAELDQPYGVAFDGAGNLYIADTMNNAIRKVGATSGIIETVAGLAPGVAAGCPGERDRAGDGCLAAAATLTAPFGVAFDAVGNLYIAGGGSVRSVDHATGIIGLFAGLGAGCDAETDQSGDGCPAADANFSEFEAWGYWVQGITFDVSGNLYVTDGWWVHVIDAATGYMYDAAGNGIGLYTGDGGPATEAGLAAPFGVAFDPVGNLYIADWGHHVVRKVTYNSTGVPVTGTPVFSPRAGVYTDAQSVTISDGTAGASIYYTTNGTTPTESSPEYKGAIAVKESTVIKAIAFKTGDTSSAVATATYTIEIPAATPAFVPDGGTFHAAQSVKITDTTPGAVIHYTTNGTTPTTASPIYTVPISVSKTATLEAIAVADDYLPSEAATATFVIVLPTATPVISPPSGTYAAAQTIKITDATAGATIYYTINGKTPTTASSKYTAPITVSASETVEAVALAPECTLSAVASAAYVIEKPAATPDISPAAGVYTVAQTVTLKDATTGAIIYYTTNGATPTTGSTEYTTPIKVSSSETIKAIGKGPATLASAVATALFTIEKPAARPAISPRSGTYAAAQSVKITDATPGASIYYTTNGKTPTAASTKYTVPIAVSASETIDAVALAPEYTLSAVASAAYVIEKPAATPSILPAGGVYAVAQTVTLKDATAGAMIYFTTNGANPTTSSAKYAVPITVSSTETIKAIAKGPTTLASAVATAVFTIEKPAATPGFSPTGGTYTSARPVKITDTTVGASIYYTTNGDLPTTQSTRYVGPITVSSSETIRAIAKGAETLESAVASAQYTIK